MLTDDDRELLRELDPEILLADGFEAAYLGYTDPAPSRQICAVYDWWKCVEVLMEDGLTEEEATEHMGFNVTGAWVGDHTPVFIQLQSTSCRRA